MTLDEIDQTLQSWRDRLRRVDENLVALDQDPTCQLLEGRDGRAPSLEGLTAQRVGPALAAMRELFEQRVLLSDVLTRAGELRGSVSRLWPSETTLKELEQLLLGKSIRLAQVRTPLAQRDLLAEAEREVRVAPEELLRAMLTSFEAARDAVTATGAAWARLADALASARSELAQLGELARDLGDAAEAELAAVRAQVEALQVRLARDPLGAAESLERSVKPLLAQARSHLTGLAAARDRARAALAQARTLLADLQAEHASATAAAARLAQEIEGAVAPALVEPGALEALPPWLVTLEARLAEGKWQTAEVGLARFSETALGYLKQDRAARDAAEAPLREREELLGRLSARQAQAQALAMRGSVLAPEVVSLALEAESLGRRRPTPLAQLAERVGAYERAVTALRARGG